MSAAMIAANTTMKIAMNLYSCFRKAMAPAAMADEILARRCFVPASSTPMSIGILRTDVE